MYTCQFFNRDGLAISASQTLLSAYNVSTDALYSYTISNDDIAFYPHDTYCLIVVTLGAMAFNLQGNITQTVKEGQALVVRFRDIVSYKSQSQSLEYIYFNYLNKARDLPYKQIFSVKADVKLMQYIVDIGEKSAPTAVVDGLFTALCYALKMSENNKISVLNVEPIEYIKQKLYFKLTNKDIAAYCKISVRSLTDIFKRRYNTTPQNYLIKLKIERAMSLLSSTATPISEIAYMLSFNSPFHFSNRFKSLVGISPSLYRKQFARETIS